jgi:hypothetical protein
MSEKPTSIKKILKILSKLDFFSTQIDLKIKKEE